ncbi:mitochondrial substrate carrier family protein ucpB-like isoform X2 [Salvia splendens]|uniref:mitochondrial substrate carrier family protein ucpB-like isoform X2 n=1 Tax=Salvia splendens TaxID=180675 RepID=UPI001C278DDE|nr:mitochondrial substrate carrier family protein ucpB-like isoform X2 [Salvia splendens]
MANALKLPVADTSSDKATWVASPSHAFYHFGTSGAAVAAASSVTHPLDLLKVRLQMQMVGQRGPLIGMRQLGINVVKTEGLRALYMGLTPGLVRSVFYGGLRLGLYEPSLRLSEMALGSPNILTKVRMQMGRLTTKGPLQELRKMAADEGLTGFWKGAGPEMTRAAVFTSSQLATYDETKRLVMRWTSLHDGFYLHLIASTVAGAASTIATAPIDVVKTRLMLQRQSKLVGNYKNGLDCAYQLLMKEGPRGFYKGAFALFTRVGPQTTITFILCEQLRELVGLKAL